MTTDHHSLPSVIIPNLVNYPRKKEYPTCPHCSLIFSKEGELKLHLTEEQWVKYMDQKFGSNLRCEQCCLFFDTNKGYMQHIGKIHEKKYKYTKCSLCVKKFKNKYAVKFHMKQVHQRATREQCPCCGKDVYNKYLLPKHLLKCEKNALRIRN